MKTTSRLYFIATALAALACTGCAHFGPKTVVMFLHRGGRGQQPKERECSRHRPKPAFSVET